jgi:hypothetical protein
MRGAGAAAGVECRRYILSATSSSPLSAMIAIRV